MRLMNLAAAGCVFTLFCAHLVEAQSSNAQVQPLIQRPGIAGTAQQSPRQPDWYPINQPHQAYINDLLDKWQASSDQVQRYQCNFNRYDYDNKFCNWRDPRNNRLAAVSIMTGEIRFAAPDKASYETLQVFDFTSPPKQEGQDAVYTPRTGKTDREKWICDGNAIFEFDFKEERLYETSIPAEMQGKGLVNSPIPFLFGASKEDILNRFWVRVITPNNVTDEVWLEAVPKKIDDARNYKKVELAISVRELLPVMLHIYAPNYDPQQNNLTSRVFEFKNRRVNGAILALKDFFNRFVRPSTPSGWQRVNRKSLQAQQHFDPKTLNRPAQLPQTNPYK